MMEEDLDTVQDEVFSKLQMLEVAELGQCAVQLNVNIPPNKRGKKTAIRSLLMNHLTSDEVQENDQVGEIFNQLLGAVVKMVSERLVVEDVIAAAIGGEGTQKQEDANKESQSSEVKGDDQVGNNNNNINNNNNNNNDNSNSNNNNNNNNHNYNTGNANARIEVTRFREFKLSNGTFGGDEDVDYPSLCYQIQEARNLHFSDQEIVSGTIKAMKNPLRKYCEGKQLKQQSTGEGGLKLVELLNSIKVFANVKESSVLVDEMRDSRQEPKETENRYVYRMMGYRDNIMVVTREEDNPLSQDFVQKKFNRAVITGFRKPTIRLCLAPLLKRGAVVDDDILMMEVNDAVNAD